jgi:GNAT superfamily N-acetyltransferase
MWMHEPPGRTVVAVESDGTVLGTAETQPNHGGPGAHIANAGFMVHPDHAGRGVGRALGQHVIAQARADGYRAMQFNAVAETNTAAVARCGVHSASRCWRPFQRASTTQPRGYVGPHVMYRRL